jgi:hypothetical protein
VAKALIVSRRFVLVSCVLLPALPLAVSIGKPDKKKRVDILKVLALRTFGHGESSMASTCNDWQPDVASPLNVWTKLKMPSTTSR